MSAAKYIRGTADYPFVWGEIDCATWAAGLVLDATGIDPAELWRGTYSTAWGCRKIVMEGGGVLALSRRGMAPFRSGGDGDGVCVVKAQGRTYAAILSAGRAWLKTNGGVICPDRAEILDNWVI